MIRVLFGNSGCVCVRRFGCLWEFVCLVAGVLGYGLVWGSGVWVATVCCLLILVVSAKLSCDLGLCDRFVVFGFCVVGVVWYLRLCL